MVLDCNWDYKISFEVEFDFWNYNSNIINWSYIVITSKIVFLKYEEVLHSSHSNLSVDMSILSTF